MIHLGRNLGLALLLAFQIPAGFSTPATKPRAEISSLKFQGVEYLHRWSKDDQHEFTPKEQTNLEQWTDMVTINHYRTVTDGEGLAATANAVLENYKKSRAIVVRTDSVPRTPDKPAEYLIVVLFPQPGFIEAAFARFKFVRGVATSAVYSHRLYGQKIGEQMSGWLKANGPLVERALRDWNDIPVLTGPDK